MSSAVIVGFVRSPFTPSNKGQLAKTRPDDIAVQVIQGLIKKTGVKVDDIEDLIMGCAFPEGEQGFNIGRMVALQAGLPVTVAGTTINRWCGSSMEAIHMAAGNIAIGKGEVFICAGVESMTRIPMGGYNPLPNPALYKDMPTAYMSMGLTAEQVAVKFSVDRKTQEAFALNSHAKAAKADFSEEIVPITTKDGVVSKDGTIRATSTPEDLAKLEPAFDAKGTVTAGTSSPLTDGAAAVLVTSEDYAKKHGLKILARIKSTAVVGLDPAVMGLGPIYASEKALKRAGLTIKDIDVVEINEAFAAQSIPCAAELKIDPAKLNIEGGAIALGHPLGASGARITGKAALLLSRGKGKYALASACIGGGMGIATVLEKA
ncbi:MAG: thiolase family protein [Rickettsiales bacterium]